MSQVTVKFNIGDVFYTFDSDIGSIGRHVVSAINIEKSTSSLTTSNIYVSLDGRMSFYEGDTYTDVEIRELANNWILEKSITIFSSAGL